MSPPLLLLTLTLTLTLLHASNAAKFGSTCIDSAPAVPARRTGCGVLPFMDQKVFGDNADSRGVAVATPTKHGMRFTLRLKRLSRPNLILTAWLVYALPGNPRNPPIFNFGYLASPLAPTHAAFTSGLGREPNQFRYTSRKSARLVADLDFNPFHANEGPLAFASFCQQASMRGIQKSAWRQPPLATVGVALPGDAFVPAGSQYLRVYDDNTGFEQLDKRGRPVLVRSPLRAYAIAVAGHIDRTTHGISPGVFAGDHWEVMSFRLDGKVVGRATRRKQ